MNFILFQKLLFVSTKSVCFSLLAEQLPALRHSLMSSQVKCNKTCYKVFIPTRRFFFHRPYSMERSQDQQLKLAVIQRLAQVHFSMTDAGQARSLNLLYISAVWFLAVGRSLVGQILIKLSLGISSGQRCQLSNENSTHSEFQRRVFLFRLLVRAIFARLA